MPYQISVSLLSHLIHVPQEAPGQPQMRKNKLLNDENVSEGQHHFGGWDGAPGGKFLLLPNPGSWQKQVEPSSFLLKTHLSRWFRQGGERPGRNGDRLSFGEGTLSRRPPSPRPSRERCLDFPQMCSPAR